MANTRATGWQTFWEYLAQHFGGGWPDEVPPTAPRPRPAHESPEALHRQLDALEARIAARRMRVLDIEAGRDQEST